MSDKRLRILKHKVRWLEKENLSLYRSCQESKSTVNKLFVMISKFNDQKKETGREIDRLKVYEKEWNDAVGFLALHGWKGMHFEEPLNAGALEWVEWSGSNDEMEQNEN